MVKSGIWNQKNMFCPKCGTENPETGRFCRSCGVDLGNVSAVLSGKLNPSVSETYVDRKGQFRSNSPDDIFSSGIRNLMMGFGFLIASMALAFTGVAGGRAWWWALLFPAFTMIAKGVSEMAKVKRLEKRTNATIVQQPSFTTNQPDAALPAANTEYVKPQGSIYDTGDLVSPPSVTEHTTKHLEINNEGETMTLPKK